MPAVEDRVTTAIALGDIGECSEDAARRAAFILSSARNLQVENIAEKA
jgi:hypothetical protein